MGKQSCEATGTLGRGRWGAARRIAALAGLAVAVLLVHRASLQAPFYLDSNNLLVEKSNLHMTEVSREALWQAIHLDAESPRIYRPLAGLSLAFTHLWAGLDPAPYRAGNIAIHVAASFALLFLFLEVLRAPRVARQRDRLLERSWPIAFIATALWSLHPVQTNVVSYVIQRMTSLSGLFSFLAVGSYLRLRTRGGWRWGAALAASSLLSVASKENGALVPIYFLLAEWLLLEPPRARTSRIALGSGWGALLVLAVVVAWLKGPGLWHTVQGGYASRPFTMTERLLTEAALQVRYVTLLVVPDPRLLTLDAEVPVSSSLLQPPGTLGGVLLVALSLVLAALWSRRRPLVSLAIAWFFAAQAMESTVLPLELYFEHRLYVPAVFLFLAAADGAAALARGRRRAAIAVAAAGSLFVSLEAWGTHYRTSLWADPLRLYGDMVAKAPGKARPRISLAVELIRRGRYREAEVLLKEALQIGGADAGCLYNLASVAYWTGDNAECERLLREIIRWEGPMAPLSRRFLALVLMSEERLEEPETLLRAALEKMPSDANTWALLGHLEAKRGRWEEAEAHLRRALRYDPTLSGAWFNLGKVLLKEGRAGEAEEAIARATALAPDDATYRNALAQVRRGRVYPAATTDPSSRSSR